MVLPPACAAAFSVSLLRLNDASTDVPGGGEQTLPWTHKERINFAKEMLSPLWRNLKASLTCGDGFQCQDADLFRFENRLFSGAELRDMIESTLSTDCANEDELRDRLLVSVEARAVGKDIYERTLLPFLEEVMQQRVPCYEPFGEDDEIPHETKVFVTHVLQNYVLRRMGKEPPKPSMALAVDEMGCGCDDCDRVNDFLADSDKEVLALRRHRGQRAHLHYEFNNQNEDLYSISTLGHTNPDTWEITKIVKPSAKQAKWEEKRQCVEDTLRELSDTEAWEDVHDFILDDCWAAIFDVDVKEILRDMRRYPISKPRLLGRTLGFYRGLDTSTLKRPIDLGDDEGEPPPKQARSGVVEIVDLTSSP